LDEALGCAVDRAAFAAAWRVDVERAAIEHLPDRGRLRQGYLVLHRQSVVSQQKFRSENAVEVEKASDEIGLAMHQMPGDDPRRAHDPPPAQVFAIEGALSGHELVIELGQRFGRQETPGLLAEQGEVLVAEKVVGFKKIKMGTLENVGSGEVELPQQEMQTTSVWLTLHPGLLAEISRRRDDLVDGLRALTHLLHSLAPIFLLCDIRDVGAWLGDGSPSQAGQVVTRETMRAQLLQGETFTPTIYLYDNQPGGIGLAERIFEVLPELLTRGLETLEACGCRSGCPSCVGPVNEVGRQAKPITLAILKRLVARR